MTALTEERFIELFSDFRKDINERFERVDKRLDSLETAVKDLQSDVKDLQTSVKDLKGFQDHESKAIEIDLQILLKKYLSSRYSTSRIIPLPMVRLWSPFTEKEIMELDTAFLFLIEPFYKTQNEFATCEKNYNIYSKNDIFILAEAKHRITKNKIKDKLQQFDEILELFKEAKHILTNYIHKNISNYITNPDSTINKAKRDFFETVRRYKFLGSIKETILFFGAAHWDKKLLNNIQSDIRKYKAYANEFNTLHLKTTKNEENKEDKIRLYKLAYEIEKHWYDNRIPLNDEQIVALTKLPSSLQFCELIIPSGDRYTVVPSSSSENYIPLTAQLDYESIHSSDDTIFTQL